MDIDNNENNNQKAVDIVNAIYAWILIIMAIALWIFSGIKSCSSQEKQTTTTVVETTEATEATETTEQTEQTKQTLTVFEKFNIKKDDPYITHVVEYGESWASIVDDYGLNKYNFTFYDLAEYNGKTYTTTIYKDGIVYVPILD